MGKCRPGASRKVPSPPPLPPPGGRKDHERPFAIPFFHQKLHPPEKCRPGALPPLGALLRVATFETLRLEKELHV